MLALKDEKDAGTSTEYQEMQYHTDEEEVIKETEWITKTNKRNKKRKMDSSPEITSGVNRAQKSQNEHKRKPPIILSQVKNYDTLYKEMNENNLEVKATMINNEQVKLNVQNIDEYRRLTKHLEDKYFWHTYENKQMRPIKVVAKRLHYSCRPKEIKSY